MLSFLFGQTPGTLKWVVDLEQEVTVCPGIDDYGNIYLTYDNGIILVNNEGYINWSKKIFYSSRISNNSVFINSKNQIFFTDDGAYNSSGDLYEIDTNGQVIDYCSTWGWDYYPPSINNNNIFLSSIDPDDIKPASLSAQNRNE